MLANTTWKDGRWESTRFVVELISHLKLQKTYSFKTVKILVWVYIMNQLKQKGVNGAKRKVADSILVAVIELLSI
jgi:N-acyl-L-homoserine lactone synthetase